MVGQIKVLGDLLSLFTLEQIKECRGIDSEILKKYRDALKNIQPQQKVEDIIENAREKETFES